MMHFEVKKNLIFLLNLSFAVDIICFLFSVWFSSLNIFLFNSINLLYISSYFQMYQVEDSYKVYQHLLSDNKGGPNKQQVDSNDENPAAAAKKPVQDNQPKKQPSSNENPQSKESGEQNNQQQQTHTPNDQNESLPVKKEEPDKKIEEKTPNDEKTKPLKAKATKAKQKKKQSEEKNKVSTLKASSSDTSETNSKSKNKTIEKKASSKRKETKKKEETSVIKPVETTSRGCSPINIIYSASIAIQTETINTQRKIAATQTDSSLKSLQSVGTDPIKEIQTHPPPKNEHQITSQVIRVQTSHASKKHEDYMMFSNMNGAPPQTPDGPRFSQDGSQLMYTHPGVQANLIEQLHTFQTQGFVCDIIMRVEGVDFKAHKIVLAASSPYFAELFRNVNAIRTDRLILEGLKPQSVAAMLGYFYLAKLIIDEEDVEDLLDAAHYFKVGMLYVSLNFLLCGYSK